MDLAIHVYLSLLIVGLMYQLQINWFSFNHEAAPFSLEMSHYHIWQYVIYEPLTSTLMTGILWIIVYVLERFFLVGVVEEMFE